MNQHTDPPLVESVVRELRDWTRQTESQFLVDVAQGQLTYYHSPRHFETPRAKDGKNPPIFSVVRALIKVFQYDLKIRLQDLETFRKRVEFFDPAGQELKNHYGSDWIEKT